MRKVTVLLLMLIVALFAVGCGQGDVANTSEESLAVQTEGGGGIVAENTGEAESDNNIPGYGEYYELLHNAQNGDTDAQYYLGRMYHEGNGVSQDYAQAVRWFRMAAEQGHPRGQNNLGIAYINGDGVSVNLVNAESWIRRSAEQGDANGLANMAFFYMNGIVVQQDHERGIYWLRRAADEGLARAKNNLGMMYLEGQGVPFDIERGLDWIEQAAQLGHIGAMYNLAINYKDGGGLGLPIDHQRMLYWLHRAAEEGEMEAQFQLGLVYSGFHDTNIPIDYEEAARWLRKAAGQGEDMAIHNLGVLHRRGVITHALVPRVEYVTRDNEINRILWYELDGILIPVPDCWDSALNVDSTQIYDRMMIAIMSGANNWHDVVFGVSRIRSSRENLVENVLRRYSESAGFTIRESDIRHFDSADGFEHPAMIIDHSNDRQFQDLMPGVWSQRSIVFPQEGNSHVMVEAFATPNADEDFFIEKLMWLARNISLE